MSTLRQSVPRYGAALPGADPRLPSISFPLNPNKTKWRTSYDNHQSERFYYWYIQDQFIEVADEVAEALTASRRQEAAYVERARYNKAYYSLDCDDGIEYSACQHEPSPRSSWIAKEMFFRLWNALNSLPELQPRGCPPYSR